MFVCVAIQGIIIINNSLARVLEYCFSSHFSEWWNYAKQNYASNPTSLFSTPLWSTSSSFFSEFGVWLILFDQKITEIFGCFCGIIEHPWILTTCRYLLHFQCTHFFPMLFAEKLTYWWASECFTLWTFFCPSVLAVLNSQGRDALFLYTSETWVCFHCHRWIIVTERHCSQLQENARLLLHMKFWCIRSGNK